VKLRVERTYCGPVCTIGSMYIDGKFECFTMEDVTRPLGEKIPGETAIPPGTYNVTITPSARFKRDLPLVENVPGFDGIRIHPGNTAADTEGCLLVGRTKGPNFVGESKVAFAILMPKIRDALDAGDTVSLEVALA
jgi:hypothetical protein